MSSTPGPRVVVIGLDVGDGPLLEALARSGELPHVARLLERGAAGPLLTPADTLHVAAWPSLYTGTMPGEHGVYYTHQAAPGHQVARRFAGDQYGQPTFWELADRAGVRCSVLDAPYTHPIAGFSGEQVFEWGTWAHYWKPDATPERLWRELVAGIGEYPLGFEANDVGLDALDPVTLVPKLEASAAKKGAALCWMLERGAPDTAPELLVGVFGETHLAAHYLWTADDPRTADATATDGLRRVYRAVDAALGTVLDRLGDETTVLLVTGDGAAPNHSGWHLLPGVLERLGWLVPAAGAVAPDHSDPLPGAGATQDAGGAARGARSPIAAFRRAVSRHLPSGVRDALMRRKQERAFDWSRTRAFCLPTDLEGCVRLNVRGREPAGVLAPEEAEDAAHGLAALLAQLVDPTTGERAVERIVVADEAFAGPRRAHLPDLVVVWRADRPIHALSAPGIGTVCAPSPDARVGTHRAPGYAIAAGPGFSAGALPPDAGVLDFAPTVLEHLDVPVPEALVGQSWGRRGPA